MRDPLKLFTGNANPGLAQRIADALGLSLGQGLVGRFKDGEIRVKLDENVRGADVFVIQPTQPPAENILELLLLIDALRRASADRITAVIPYYGYGRQDKKDEPRVPVSAKLCANLIVVAGADRVLTLDLHAEQIQAFFDIPVDHLYATPVLSEYFKGRAQSDYVVVSPDPGGVKRAQRFAKRLGNPPIAVIDKRRPTPNQAHVANVVGEVGGRIAIILDDIIDTGHTILDAARALLERGAREVLVCATHPIFSGDCGERLEQSPIQEVVVTDTIPLAPGNSSTKVRIRSVAGLLAEAIQRTHHAQSVSSLFL